MASSRLLQAHKALTGWEGRSAWHGSPKGMRVVVRQRSRAAKEGKFSRPDPLILDFRSLAEFLILDLPPGPVCGGLVGQDVSALDIDIPADRRDEADRANGLNRVRIHQHAHAGVDRPRRFVPYIRAARIISSRATPVISETRSGVLLLHSFSQLVKAYAPSGRRIPCRRAPRP